jgi:DNA-binding transcriptional regulator YdaS (Cro superfamily)
MFKSDVVAHFHTQVAAARALGISEAAVSFWADDKPIPKGRAYQLEVITGGALTVDASLYETAA